MPRQFSARSAVIAALCFGSPVAAQQAVPQTEADLASLAQRTTSAVVLISVQAATGPRQGSGFIVDAGGLVITNAHVVRDALSATVKLASGDVYDRVTILARDQRRDIAVLQVEGFNLPTLVLGDSDSVAVGAPVVLIGSPLGLENTVSTGIVSGRRREPSGSELIQITAPASQGSSGGAVISVDGSVIGVAGSQLQGGQNLNFAIPINYARGLLAHLGAEPAIVLEAASAVNPSVRPGTGTGAVNRGMEFDASELGGLVIELETDLGDQGRRRTRITYRIIETIGESPVRLEQYVESETTRTTEPFRTQQTLSRQRERSIVRLDGLRPMSSSGEVTWLTPEGWRSASHDIRFEGSQALGVVTDSAGQSTQIDRTLPDGILLRDMRDVAFGTLDADSLVGMSVEFTTFDPRTGTLAEDRYDVLSRDTVVVQGVSQDVIRANVASGLSNRTVFFTRAWPRVPVRSVSQDGLVIENATRVEGLEPPM